MKTHPKMPECFGLEFGKWFEKDGKLIGEEQREKCFTCQTYEMCYNVMHLKTNGNFNAHVAMFAEGVFAVLENLIGMKDNEENNNSPGKEIRAFRSTLEKYGYGSDPTLDEELDREE